MTEPTFSLITIVNKEEVYQEFKANLAEQKQVNYELIKIDNRENQYDSARAAFNLAAKKASGEYLVFLHPDIRFLDELALRDILFQIVNLGDFGVAGIAGSPYQLNEQGRNYIVTTLIQDKKREKVGEPIKRATAVQTVDECFFVMSKAFFEKHPFSDIKGWHFYSVEQCLVALINDRQNYVVPARIWHLSPGSSENTQYIKTGREIIKRYGDYFPRINTTVEKWETSGIKSVALPWVNFVYHKAKRKLKEYPFLYQAGRKIKKAL